jgi:hypothetical protein
MVEEPGTVYGRLRVVEDLGVWEHDDGKDRHLVLCECVDCGRRQECLHGTLRQGHCGCAECSYEARRVKDRACRFCGKALGPQSRLASSCQACDRRRHRNGMCPCGEQPAYRSKPCPSCGRRP